MTEFRISAADSLRFAELSGDFNRQHVDPISARRLPFGGTVVHGLHTVLKALDEVAQMTRSGRLSIEKIRVSFISPIRQGDVAKLSINRVQDRLEISVHVGTVNACNVTLDLGRDINVDVAVKEQRFQPSDPVTLSSSKLPFVKGSIDFVISSTLCGFLFPHAISCFPEYQLAALLSSTRLVGMMCPGEHSIFKFLSLTFTAPVTSCDYRVERFDSATRLCSLALTGDGMKGSIHAILRAEPVDQAAYQDISARITDKSFADRTVLVVGGSRGLGEVAAKIAAARGAQIIVGFATGEADAHRVSNDINSGGGKSHIFQLDVRSGRTSLALLSESVTDLFYFASPRIEFNFNKYIDRNLLNKYFNFYVYGLEDLIEQIIIRQSDTIAGLNIFVPSSEFVDNPEDGAFEYAAAKAALEVYGVYCARKFRKPIKFNAPRLPRMSTDQTSSIKSTLPDPITVLARAMVVE